MAGGGPQVSRRGGGRHRWAQSCRMPGAGAQPGWAGLMSFGRRRQSWAVSSAPAGPDAGARVRGQWVGIQPRDPPPPPSLGRWSGGAGACAEVAAGTGCPMWWGRGRPNPPPPDPQVGLEKGAHCWAAVSLRLCWQSTSGNGPLPHLGALALGPENLQS